MSDIYKSGGLGQRSISMAALQAPSLGYGAINLSPLKALPYPFVRQRRGSSSRGDRAASVPYGCTRQRRCSTSASGGGTGVLLRAASAAAAPRTVRWADDVAGEFLL
eukprot:TRINITY_DN26529_c0_g1_i1.p1 TRINITY_DN26529_c0_g1~~TRINITY_DN26529_c0_g1_i1.p1  ORF type:complete len:107 (+),score=3.00 TRINITY_DN26529_c0_g1_i1:279-599(+)